MGIKSQENRRVKNQRKKGVLWHDKNGVFLWDQPKPKCYATSVESVHQPWEFLVQFLNLRIKEQLCKIHMAGRTGVHQKRKDITTQHPVNTSKQWGKVVWRKLWSRDSKSSRSQPAQSQPLGSPGAGVAWVAEEGPVSKTKKLSWEPMVCSQRKMQLFKESECSPISGMQGMRSWKRR